MKKIIISMALLSVAAMFQSCNKGEVEAPIGNVPAGELVINAESEGVCGPDRAQMAYKYDVLWDLKDQITVTGAAGTDTFSLVDGDGTTVGKFRQDGKTVKFSGKVTAYYPSSIYDNGTLTWPAVQTAAMVIPMSCEKTLTGSTDEVFKFKGLGSVLQIVFSTPDTGVKLRSITVKDADKAMSGEFTVVDGKAVMATGNDAVKLDLGEDGVALGVTARTFNIAVPSAKYNDVSLTFTATDGKVCELESTTLPEINYNTVAKLTLSGSFKQKEAPDIDKYKPVPAEGYKIATMWIEFMPNRAKLGTPESCRTLLDKIQDAGFNSVVLDVRPVSGNVLYKTAYGSNPGDDRTKVYIPTISTINGFNFTTWHNKFEGGDFVKWFIDECHNRKMTVTLSASIMPIGKFNAAEGGKGPAYLSMDGTKVKNNTRFADMCAWEYASASGSSNTANDHNKLAFMSPTNPWVHDYVLTMVTEIVSKYQPDGFALDYLRYQDKYSDTRGTATYFTVPEGGTSAEAFAKYLKDNYGKEIDITTQYPTCAFTIVGGSQIPGTYFKEWVEFRSAQIQGYVKDLQAAIHEVKSDCEVQYWADAYPKWEQGQNWGSKDIDHWNVFDTDVWRNANYYKTGFANYLDLFLVGAYRAYVSKAEAADKGETAPTASVEGSIENAKESIGNACRIYGSYEVNDNKTYDFIRDAAYMCMAKSAGLMVFDLSHFVNVPGAAKCQDPWKAVKDGIVMWRYDNGEVDLR